MQVLGEKGGAAVPALADVMRVGPIGGSAAQRRLGGDAHRWRRRPRRGAASAGDDADETTRQAALHSVSVRRDREAVPALVKLLKSPSLHNRRAAAEALGRIGDKSAVPALLEARRQAGRSRPGTFADLRPHRDRRRQSDRDGTARATMPSSAAPP